ncbi:hypothetical protein Tco_0520533 [Tanacetum coccineum]
MRFLSVLGKWYTGRASSSTKTLMGLLDYISTADPLKKTWKVQAWSSAPSAGENGVAEDDVNPVGPPLRMPLCILLATLVTSSRGKQLVYLRRHVGGSSQPETSEESADSFYETVVLNSKDAKRWSRTEHELELKEKLRAKYDARGVLLRERDAEIARLKSLVKEKETESAEVFRLRDQVSVLTAEKSSLSAEVSVLRGILITSCPREEHGLASEVSTLHSAFHDFKEKMEAHQKYRLKCSLGVAGTLLSAVMAYNPEAVEAHYLDDVKALEEADFPLVQLLKSKKYSGIDEVLDCLLWRMSLADLPEAARFHNLPKRQGSMPATLRQYNGGL